MSDRNIVCVWGLLRPVKSTKN